LFRQPRFGRYTAENTADGPLGPGWTHNYNVQFSKLGHNVAIKDWKGTERVFIWEDNAWKGGANVHGSSTLSRDANGNFHWRLRHGTTYLFEDAHNFRLASITDRQGNTLTLNYDGNSRLTSAVDANGRAVSFVNDGNGRITQMTDPLNRTSLYTYDPDGQLTKVTDALGFKAAYRYAPGSPGRLQAVVNARGNTNIVYTYDGAGKIIATTNALGHATLYSRDDVMGWVKVTRPKGNAHTNYYNEDRQVILRADAAGTTWLFRDNQGRVTNRLDRLGYTNHYHYAEGSCTCQISGQLLKHEDPLGRVNLWSYETNFHFKTAFTNAAGHVWRWAYDHRGNLTHETNALLGVTTMQYDAAGNRTNLIDALNRTTRFAFDQYGNRTNVTDALGHRTTFEYDLIGRLTRRVDALGRATSLAYDGRDRLVKQVDPLGRTNSWAYDGNGNRTAHTNELGHVTHYAYDNATNSSPSPCPAAAVRS